MRTASLAASVLAAPKSSGSTPTSTRRCPKTCGCGAVAVPAFEQRLYSGLDLSMIDAGAMQNNERQTVALLDVMNSDIVDPAEHERRIRACPDAARVPPIPANRSGQGSACGSRSRCGWT